MAEVGPDGWPVGEKRFHCANCFKSILKANGKHYPDPTKCHRKKRVGIGFCRDWVEPKGGK